MAPLRSPQGRGFPGSPEEQDASRKGPKRQTKSDRRRAARRAIERLARERHDAWAKGRDVDEFTQELDAAYEAKRERPHHTYSASPEVNGPVRRTQPRTGA